jgi:single-stranded DNA-binding protein
MLRNVTFSGTLCNVEMKQANSGAFYLRGALKVYQGNDKDDAWYDVLAFNSDKVSVNIADNIADCFGGGVKSLPVIIKGSLEQSTYEKKDGSKAKNHTIFVEEMAVSVVFGPVFIQKDGAPTQAASSEPLARPMSEVAEGESPF